MPRFSANLSTLFTELEFLDRFAAAAEAGFDAVEFQFPYAFKAGDIAQRLKDAGQALVLFNLPAGDSAAGEIGLACLAGRQDEFREGVARAIDYAGVMGCSQVNALAGKAVGDAAEAQGVLADNLAYAAEQLGAAGVRLLAEAVNTRDRPGFFLPAAHDVLAVIDKVGSPNLYLQYDLYHAHVMATARGQTLALDLTATLKRLDRVAHVQVADDPGRHEPGTGTVDLAAAFAALDAAGYAGWIGAEYMPAGETAAGLGWLEDYR